MNTTPGTPATEQRIDEQSLAELLRRLSEQSSRLAHQEVELAKAEMTVKARQLGIGAGAFGGAAIVALFALGALVATAILALATAMNAWLAALIVAVVLGAVAGALALAGRERVAAGTPPAPERAIDSTKHDIQTAKHSVHQGRSH
jgi:hypothetical protein